MIASPKPSAGSAAVMPLSSGAAAWRPTKLLAIDVAPDDHPVGIEDGADEPLGSRLGARKVDEEIRAVGQAEHVERLASQTTGT